MMTEWRIISDFTDYAVSDDGVVRRVIEGKRGRPLKVLKPSPDRLGYRVVTLFREGKPSRKRISRLVCAAFLGAPPTPEHQAAHGDGNTSNDSVQNLRWATGKENMADCLIHGTRAAGSRHGRNTQPEQTSRGSSHYASKMTERDILAIRSAPKLFGSGVKLAAQYGITPTAIYLIRSRKNWSHV